MLIRSAGAAVMCACLLAGTMGEVSAQESNVDTAPARRTRPPAAPGVRQDLDEVAAPQDAKVEAIEQALEAPTTTEFVDTPLVDALMFLAQFHKIDIILDPDVTDFTISPDTPVNLDVAELRLESVLNLLLRPLALDWVIRDQVLVVTTRDAANSFVQTEVYDLSRLQVETTPSEISEVIQATVAPASWASNQLGPMTLPGRMHMLGASLVIRQTQRNQRQIARLLKKLEAQGAAARGAARSP